MTWCRFVAHGGWEQSFDVDPRLPPSWVIAEPPQHQPATFTAAAAAGPLVIKRRVFHRGQWREGNGDREFVYVEDDAAPSSVKPHECAGLKHARERIHRLEKLCEQALDALDDPFGPVKFDRTEAHKALVRCQHTDCRQYPELGYACRRAGE